MKERIKKLRKEKHLTQQEFADKIGISRNNVATYEVGKSNPGEAVISLICREFHINEAWLRTGEGKMYKEGDNTLLSQLSMEYGLDAAQKTMVQNFLSLPVEYRTAIVEIVKGLAKGISHPTKEPAAAFTEEELAAYEKVKAAKEAEDSIDKEVAAYRAELEAEEKTKARSSASPGAGDAGKESA